MRRHSGLFFLLLVGCSTPYHEMGILGGVKAEQVSSDTYRIVSRGNAYTGSTTVQDYTLLKAAETTREVGAPIIVISAADASRAGAVVSPGQATTTFHGNTASTTYSPATVHNYIKPGQDTYIRVVKVAAGQVPPLRTLGRRDYSLRRLARATRLMWRPAAGREFSETHRVDRMTPGS